MGNCKQFREDIINQSGDDDMTQVFLSQLQSQDGPKVLIFRSKSQLIDFIRPVLKFISEKVTYLCFDQYFNFAVL